MPLSRRRSRVPISPAAPVMRTLCMAGRSILAQFGGEFLVALAAAHEMAPHGGTRRRHGAGADRLHDLLVLLLDPVQIGLAFLRRPGRHAHGLARNDEAS